MNKVYLFLFFVLVSIFIQARVDCNPVFVCKPVNVDKSIANALEIHLKEGESDEYTFELYDLNLGKIVFKQTSFFRQGEKKVIFSKVPTSTYTVVFSSTNCKTKKTIAGKGITLL
jgi:hypothetical protein